MEAYSEVLLYRSHYRDLQRSCRTLGVASVVGGGQHEPPAGEPIPAKPKLTACTLAAVVGLGFVDCVGMNLLTPYAADMVGQLLDKPSTSPEVLGSVGWLIGSYNIAEMVVSPFWGWLSDRVGRRPVIVASFGAAAVVPILFGLSKSFAMAIAVRTLNGILVGSNAITKTYVAELIPKDDEARVFSILVANAALGSMVGPLLGGLLQTPTHWSPAAARFFNTGVFKVFADNPYLLPNLIFSVCACLVWVLVFFCLKESLPREERDARRAALAAEKAQKAAEKEEVAGAEEGLGDGAGGRKRNTLLSLVAKVPFLNYPSDLLRAIGSYGLVVGYITATLQNIILLYQIPVEDHGYGLSPGTLGLVQSVTAIGLLIVQIFIYPRLVLTKGYRWNVAVGLLSVLAATLPLPLYGVLYDPQRFGPVRLAPLVFMMVVQQAAFGLVTPTATVWINRFSEGMDRGTINGWAQSFGALCRALAPVLVGDLQSLSDGWTWSGSRYLTLVVISLLAPAVGGLLLPVLPGKDAAAPKLAEKPVEDAGDEESVHDPAPARAAQPEGRA